MHQKPKSNPLMKSYKHLLGLLFIAIVISSCQKKPEASFTFSPEDAKSGDQISFKNTTTDANSYEWDFGDGTTSTEENPTHTYDSPGIYDVILTAYTGDKAKKDLSFQQIEIEMTTSMELTVRNIYNYGLEENCRLSVYGSSSDYNNSTNAIDIKYTDNQGTATFYNIQAQTYYVKAYKIDGSYILTNDNLAIVTPVLTPNIVNSYVVYIELN